MDINVGEIEIIYSNFIQRNYVAITKLWSLIDINENLIWYSLNILLLIDFVDE
jgi:hypothetical protein